LWRVPPRRRFPWLLRFLTPDCPERHPAWRSASNPRDGWSATSGRRRVPQPSSLQPESGRPRPNRRALRRGLRSLLAYHSAYRLDTRPPRSPYSFATIRAWAPTLPQPGMLADLTGPLEE